ncbi:MAG: ABC transporter permease [Gemmatimonadetes bacterium]|nr:ABC transporter permease [Gemmatimonadota bacterium]
MTRATWRRREGRWARWGLLLLTTGALVVPWVTPPSAAAIGDVLATRLVPPLTRDGLGQWHLLGTDAFGRDLFLRLWQGARVSLGVGVSGALLSGALGIALGALAGWRGGASDRMVSAVADTLLAVPRLVLLLVVAALWGPGTVVVVSVLALTGWMAVMRLVRAEVRLVRTHAYVEGALALGAPPCRLLVRHVLPNALGGAGVAITLGVGNAMVLESGLSFLGLGVQPPAASWGSMISAGREWLLAAPWVALAPGAALVLAVLACTRVGDALATAEREGEPSAPAPDVTVAARG